MNLNRKNKWIILIASLLVIIATAIFVYFKFFQVNAKYFMVADNVGSLTNNDQVVIQGTEIGEIRSIDIHPDINKLYLLELAIDRDINFPDKSFGEIIKADGDPGNWVIGISLLASDRYFEKNDTIPLKSLTNIAKSETDKTIELPDDVSDSLTAVVNKKIKNSPTDENIIYKIQFMISKDTISLTSSKFKGLNCVTFYHENGFYKYIVGNEDNMEGVNKLCSEVKAKGFKDAFVIAFRDGKRIPMNEAR